MKASFILLIVFAGILLNGYADRGIKPPGTNVGIKTKIIVANLDVPWEIAWGPDNCIWFTAQGGTVSKINPETGEKQLLLRIAKTFRNRSTGLLGMTIHPDRKLPYVFLDYTYKEGKKVFLRLVRYTYTNDTLIHPLVLLNNIPATTGHAGSRLVIAPDGKLMLTVGDATNGNSAQDTNALTGKILRLNIDGSIPVDNPFGGSPVWSTGHRNPQGLAFTGMGRLFSSEHGDAIGDELNLIKRGGNYGWPHVEGFCDTEKEQLFCKTHAVTAPVKAWTPVIAPAGITYCGTNCSIKEWRNALLLVTLKTQSLRVLKLNEAGTEVIAEQVYLDHEFGRLRGVCVSPAGEVYVSTSNRDWNPGEGYPKQVDDRIIKILPGDSINSGFVQQKQVKPALADGAVVYNNYCVSCHKNDGEGLEGVFPPLRGTQEVLGDKNRLIKIILKGLSGPVTIKGRKYDQQMPAFDFLSDREIALVATYVRTHFGNSAENITGAHVAKVRGAGKK